MANTKDGVDDEPSSRDPRWQRRPTERRREIVDAAVEVFGASGFEGATIADVARRAGVSTGTVVHYFGSKAGLFQAAMVERFLEQVESLEEVIAGHRGSSRDLLRAVLTRAWKHLMRPMTVDLMICAMSQAQSHPEASGVMLRETGDRWRRLMGAVLSAGVATGEFRPMDIDVQARIIGAGLKGLAMGTCHHSTHDLAVPGPDALLAAYLDLLDHALAAVPLAIPVLPYGDGV